MTIDDRHRAGQTNAFLVILVFVVIGFAAFYVILQQKGQPIPSPSESPSLQGGRVVTPAYDSEWKGILRAGRHSPLLEFTAGDFTRAVQGERLVVVYYYAPECASCAKEIPELIAAFNALSSDRVIGFLMNYRDPVAKDAIAQIARDYGIGLDNTKAFLLHGGRVLKAIDSWDRERYLREITAFVPR